MTEIAVKAGASIGSLYQFFPTKAAIADTLRAAAGDFMCREWNELRESGAAQSPQEFAAELFDIGNKMLATFPAFVPLLSIRGEEGVNVSRVRTAMNDALNALLKSRMPTSTKTEIEATGVIIREMMRCRVDIETNESSAVRSRALGELQVLLVHYLGPKLKN